MHIVGKEAADRYANGFRLDTAGLDLYRRFSIHVRLRQNRQDPARRRGGDAAPLAVEERGMLTIGLSAKSFTFYRDLAARDGELRDYTIDLGGRVHFERLYLCPLSFVIRPLFEADMEEVRGTRDLGLGTWALGRGKRLGQSDRANMQNKKLIDAARREPLNFT